MPAEAVRNYLIHALEAGPAAVARVLADARDWDARPDPERFSLREVAAHLADWEAIWQDRVRRITLEENPFLPSIDEGQLAIVNNYATSDPAVSIGSYGRMRAQLVEGIRSLPENTWGRMAHREFVGDVTFADLVAMIIGHDGYHLKQVLEWTKSA